MLVGVGTQRYIYGNEKLLNFFCYLECPDCLTFDAKDIELTEQLRGQDMAALTEDQLGQIFKATSRAKLDLETEIMLTAATIYSKEKKN